MRKQTIDLSPLQDENQLHRVVKDLFQFPEFYGNNIHALIDCWSSLRFPEDEMTKTVLEKDEQLILELRGTANAKIELVRTVLIAIENVNQREISKNRTPSILVLLC